MKIFTLYLVLQSLSVAAGFNLGKPKASNNIRGDRSIIEEANDISNPIDGSSIQAMKDRRQFFKQIVVAAAATVSAVSNSSPVFAEGGVEGSDALTDVYFGVGCFWHIQHEFVEAEKKILGRGPNDFTSRTGYAGGNKSDNGKVCYHNMRSIADYGKLGHGEVVGMSIPENKIGDFAVEYFNLFTAKGERVDPMDRGGEYRSLLGLPGGSKHPMYPSVLAAAEAKGMSLQLGKGNDPDTLGKKMVWVYDSKEFPFYQAEVYHQFHNDFQSPAYGKAYNSLADLAFDDGRIKSTGCPDRV